MTALRKLVILGVLCCCLAPVAGAGRLEGQAVTYADFSHVNDIASSMSHVYFATTEGIIRYNKMTSSWEEPLTGADGVDSRDIQRVWVDVFDEKLFAKTSFRYYEYDLLFDEWFPMAELPNIETKGAHVGPPPVMYAPPGYMYSADGQLIGPDGRRYTFTDIFDDRSGNLWLGTWGHGPIAANSASYVMEFLTFGLLQNRVNTMMFHGDQLWLSGAALGEDRSGVTEFDLERNTFRHYESGLDNDFPIVDINAMAADDKTLYLGTPFGLLLFDREMGRVRRRLSDRRGLIDDNVLSLAIMGDTLIVGTEAGLSILTEYGDSARAVHPDVFQGQIIYDLEVDDSTVWVAATEGAYRVTMTTGRIQRLSDPDLYLSSWVTAVERFEDDIWFASRYGVVRVRSRTGDFESYPEAAGAGDINALAVNDTMFATGSNQGLTITYYQDGRRNTRGFTTDDGLASNYVYSLLMDGDYIWVGTELGVTRFWWNNPRRID